MIEKIKKCFSKDPVNLGPQRELYIAKGIFIILMSFSHCIEILGWFFDPKASAVSLWHDIDMVIKSSVIVVMACMGISLCYSSRKSATALLHRALEMLGIVALLEFSRTIIPCFIEWLIFHDFGSIRYAYQFLSVDILQFATLMFLLIALFKKIKLKPTTMILIASAFSVIGQLLRGVTTGSFYGDIAVGFLWHSYDAAYFPLLNWFIAPVIGYALGYAWLRLKDKETFFKLVTPISWVISIIYFVSMDLSGQWYYLSSGDFCGMGLLDILIMFTVFIAISGTSYFLIKWMPRVSCWLESMGVRINSIYCIHWVIYSFLYLILTCVVGDNFIPTWAVTPTAVLVLFAANTMSSLYKKCKNKRNLTINSKKLR